MYFKVALLYLKNCKGFSKGGGNLLDGELKFNIFEDVSANWI
jgi:hypothetical protein